MVDMGFVADLIEMLTCRIMVFLERLDLSEMKVLVYYTEFCKKTVCNSLVVRPECAIPKGLDTVELLEAPSKYPHQLCYACYFHNG